MAAERPPSPPRQPPTSGFEALDHTQLLEEERFPWYTPERYYPVRIGEVFDSRYQVVGKLGFGSASTVWLCRDLGEHRYVTLKVYAGEQRQSRNELKVLEHLKTIRSSHPGSRYVRSMLDAFEISGQRGPHQCLVHEPLGLSASDFRLLFNEKMPQYFLRPIIKHLLLALDFLHCRAGVVHTDIKGRNILMALVDDSRLKEFEREEWAEPSARKIEGRHVTYASRALDALDVPDKPGRFVLCDFGEARFGEVDYIGEVMPDLYRAPEIVLGIPWDEKIDIWSVGLLIWDLFEGKHLFNERLPSRDASGAAHLARTIALLGPPPKDLLEFGAASADYFDENGEFTADVEINVTSLEAEEENLQGWDKTLFLSFLRKMLQWRPEDRASAKELLRDPWMLQEPMTDPVSDEQPTRLVS